MLWQEESGFRFNLAGGDVDAYNACVVQVQDPNIFYTDQQGTI